jgi:hypothetical protein
VVRAVKVQDLHHLEERVVKVRHQEVPQVVHHPEVRAVKVLHQEAKVRAKEDQLAKEDHLEEARHAAEVSACIYVLLFFLFTFNSRSYNNNFPPLNTLQINYTIIN